MLVLSRCCTNGFLGKFGVGYQVFLCTGRTRPSSFNTLYPICFGRALTEIVERHTQWRSLADVKIVFVRLGNGIQGLIVHCSCFGYEQERRTPACTVYLIMLQ